MKFLVTLGLFLVINACSSSPLASYRWNVSPDGEGNMHLIDTNPINEEIEPMFVPERDVAFLLFTRSDRSGRRLTDMASVRGSSFNPDHPVRILIHGWNSGPNSGVNTASTESYLQIGEFNVIVCDWSIGAGTINYVSARNRVGSVADVLARFLDDLVRNGLTRMENVFIAGHSLGAHIAGLTGKRVTEGRIQAIFSLDAAGVLFSFNSPNERIDVNDAVYTEGIHTNAGNLGFDVPITHAAFYPNHGSSQPGCGIDATGNCAHSRAHGLFAESIISRGFVARRCNGHHEITGRNCGGTGEIAVMGGEPAAIGRSGVFFLQTNSNSPWAMW